MRLWVHHDTQSHGRHPCDTHSELLQSPHTHKSRVQHRREPAMSPSTTTTTTPAAPAGVAVDGRMPLHTSFTHEQHADGASDTFAALSAALAGGTSMSSALSTLPSIPVYDPSGSVFRDSASVSGQGPDSGSRMSNTNAAALTSTPPASPPFRAPADGSTSYVPSPPRTTSVSAAPSHASLVSLSSSTSSGTLDATMNGMSPPALHKLSLGGNMLHLLDQDIASGGMQHGASAGTAGTSEATPDQSRKLGVVIADNSDGTGAHGAPGCYSSSTNLYHVSEVMSVSAMTAPAFCPRSGDAFFPSDFQLFSPDASFQHQLASQQSATLSPNDSTFLQMQNQQQYAILQHHQQQQMQQQMQRQQQQQQGQQQQNSSPHSAVKTSPVPQSAQQQQQQSLQSIQQMQMQYDSAVLNSAVSCATITDLMYDATLNSARSPSGPTMLPIVSRRDQAPAADLQGSSSSAFQAFMSPVGTASENRAGLSEFLLSGEYLHSPPATPTLFSPIIRRSLSSPGNSVISPIASANRIFGVSSSTGSPSATSQVSVINSPDAIKLDTTITLQTNQESPHSGVGSGMNNLQPMPDFSMMNQYSNAGRQTRSVSMSSMGSYNTPSIATPATIGSVRLRRASSTERAMGKSVDAETVFVTNTISDSKGQANKTRIDIMANQAAKDQEGNYICPFPTCKKVYPKQYNLRSHLVSHCAERPYQCTHCDKAFQRKHDLQRHLGSIHANQMPFICPCGEKFQKAEMLRKHRISKHPSYGGRKRAMSSPVQPTFLSIHQQQQQQQQRQLQQHQLQQQQQQQQQLQQQQRHMQQQQQQHGNLHNVSTNSMNYTNSMAAFQSMVSANSELNDVISPLTGTVLSPSRS